MENTCRTKQEGKVLCCPWLISVAILNRTADDNEKTSERIPARNFAIRMADLLENLQLIQEVIVTRACSIIEFEQL